MRWFIRRLAQMTGEQILSIVRALDNQMNNTSLVARSREGPGLFLNTSIDATLLGDILAAAVDVDAVPSSAVMEADVTRFAVEPLFVRGVSDAI